MLDTSSDSNLLIAITDFVNLLLTGDLPLPAKEIIFGGRLLALQKKDGGIRPIAVGYTLRRLAAKCANAFVIRDRSQALRPIQIGVGVQGGAEAAIHASRRIMQHLPDGHVFVKLDFSNAFNSVRRDLLLRTAASHLPGIYRFIHASLSCDSKLLYGQEIILSSEGTQQGDPLGSLEFCEAINDTLIQSVTNLTLAYIDDVNLEGPISEVADKVDFIINSHSNTGLCLNVQKCEIICNDWALVDNFPIFQKFCRIEKHDLTLLGAPILEGQAVDSVLRAKLDALKLSVKRLSHLPSHDAFFLLKNSLSIPKLQYILRTSPCAGNPILTDLDNTLKQGLSVILNVEFNTSQWTQASLPVSKGGLGIRSVCMLASSAFLASAAATLRLQEEILAPSSFAIQPDQSISAATAHWKSLSTCLEPVSSARHLQFVWDNIVCDDIYNSLMASHTSPIDQARLRAASAPHSGDWINTLPLSAVGLRLSNEDMRVAVGYRIGANICQPHTCLCGSTVDARGLHALSCRKSGPRHSRHAQINDLIWRAIRKSQVPACKEPVGLSRSDGKRPDGASLIPWSRGRPMAWDITVPDTYAASHIGSTSTSAGAAAEKAAVNKTVKYTALADTHFFIPVAVETGGAWCITSMNFISDLGKRITAISNDQLETIHLFQRISIALQRGNAIAFHNTFLPVTASDINICQPRP